MARTKWLASWRAYVVLAALLSGSLMPVAFSTDAAVAVTCDSNPAISWFDGYALFNAHDNAGQTYEGIDGNIENQDMSLCDAVANDSVSAWVMMAGGDGAAFAQAGYIKYLGGCNYFFLRIHQRARRRNYASSGYRCRVQDR